MAPDRSNTTGVGLLQKARQWSSPYAAAAAMSRTGASSLNSSMASVSDTPATPTPSSSRRFHFTPPSSQPLGLHIPVSRFLKPLQYPASHESLVAYNFKNITKEEILSMGFPQIRPWLLRIMNRRDIRILVSWEPVKKVWRLFRWPLEDGALAHPARWGLIRARTWFRFMICMCGSEAAVFQVKDKNSKLYGKWCAACPRTIKDDRCGYFVYDLLRWYNAPVIPVEQLRPGGILVYPFIFEDRDLVKYPRADLREYTPTSEVLGEFQATLNALDESDYYVPQDTSSALVPYDVSSGSSPSKGKGKASTAPGLPSTLASGSSSSASPSSALVKVEPDELAWVTNDSDFPAQPVPMTGLSPRRADPKRTKRFEDSASSLSKLLLLDKTGPTAGLYIDELLDCLVSCARCGIICVPEKFHRHICADRLLPSGSNVTVDPPLPSQSSNFIDISNDD